MRLVSVMQVPAGPAQLKQFKDPVFRISNLYSIRTREGKVIPFRPRPQQLQVFKKGGQTVAYIKCDFGRLIPAAVLRKELGCAELVWHTELTGHAVLINHLVDLTELVIGANLAGGSLHRCD